MLWLTSLGVRLMLCSCTKSIYLLSLLLAVLVDPFKSQKLSVVKDVTHRSSSICRAVLQHACAGDPVPGLVRRVCPCLFLLSEYLVHVLNGTMACRWWGTCLSAGEQALSLGQR
jgi:hypothetical protein